MIETSRFGTMGRRLAVPFLFLIFTMKKTLFDTSTLTNSQKVQGKYFLVVLPFIIGSIFIFDSWFARGFWIIAFIVAASKAAEKAVTRKAHEKILNQE